MEPIVRDVTSSEQRQQALAKIREASTQIEGEARRRGMTPEELQVVVQEECNAVRYGKQP